MDEILRVRRLVDLSLCKLIRQLSILILATLLWSEGFAQSKCAEVLEATATQVPAGLAAFESKYHNDPFAQSAKAPSLFQRMRAALKRKFDPVEALRNGPKAERGSGHHYNTVVINFNNEGKPPVLTRMTETAFPYRGFRGDSLSYQGEGFKLMNVGTHQLAEDWPGFERAVARARRQYPNRNVEVVMPNLWMTGESILTDWRTHTSLKVTQVYQKRKSYLSEENNFTLRRSDQLHDQQDDYFVLLKDSQVSPLAMSQYEFDRDALASIRIARLASRGAEVPSSLFHSNSDKGTLPFHQRDAFDQAEHAIRAFRKLEARGLRIGEISRFAKFQDVPEAVLDLLVKKALETAALDIDVVIISVDPLTRRLFKNRYNFEDLMVLDSASQEQLLYIDTRSPQFLETLSKLTVATKDVLSTPNNNLPKSDSKRPFWDKGSEFWKGSDSEVLNPVFQRFEDQQEQRSRERTDHVQSRSRQLTNELAKSALQHTKIVDWILSPEGDMECTSVKLTRGEKRVLEHNVQLYSNFGVNQFLTNDVPPKGKILIYGKDAFASREALEDSVAGRLIEIRPLTDAHLSGKQEYDHIIVYDSLNKIADESTRHNLLKLLILQLKPGRRLHLFEPFTDVPSSGDRSYWTSLRKQLKSEAEFLARIEAPLSEFEMGIHLYQQKRIFESRQATAISGNALTKTILENNLGEVKYFDIVGPSLGLNSFEIRSKR